MAGATALLEVSISVAYCVMVNGSSSELTVAMLLRTNQAGGKEKALRSRAAAGKWQEPVQKLPACIGTQPEGSSRLIAEARPPAGQVCKAPQVLQYCRLTSGCPPPKSGNGLQFCRLVASAPSSCTAGRRPFGTSNRHGCNKLCKLAWLPQNRQDIHHQRLHGKKIHKVAFHQSAVIAAGRLIFCSRRLHLPVGCQA